MTVRSLSRGQLLAVASTIVLSGLVGSSMVGCGKQSGSEVADAGTAADTVAVSAKSTSAATTVPPTNVVSQFLDLVRRGGGDSGASTLLTAKAQSELNRIGRSVQPIGSPDAKFVVTRAESVPDNPNASLVHSIWQEPQGDSSASSGAILEYQVVWALQKEANQWRISGLAMEIDPNQSPLIVNFEDGNRMAALLAEAEIDAPETESRNQMGDSASGSAKNSGPEATNAANQNSTLNR